MNSIVSLKLLYVFTGNKGPNISSCIIFISSVGFKTKVGNILWCSCCERSSFAGFISTIVAPLTQHLLLIHEVSRSDSNELDV